MLTLEALAELARLHTPDLSAEVASFELRGRLFGGGERPHLMGVINLSRDSWYRESVVLSVDAAIRRGLRLAAEGADLVDLGAESTLDHAKRAEDRQQIDALVPIVAELERQGVATSVETYLPAVAKACLEAGAAVLNLTGTTGTEEMYRMVAANDAGVIICFVEGPHVREVGELSLLADPVPAMRDYFYREIERAQAAGVSRIWIDAGLGFYYRNLQDSATRVAYQLRTFLNTFRLRSLGWPTCHALPHAFEYFEDEVRTAEAFFAVMAVLGKTDLLRTHEVSKVRGVVGALGTLG